MSQLQRVRKASQPDETDWRSIPHAQWRPHMKPTNKLYSDLCEPLKRVLRRHGRSTIHIATGFLSPNVDAAVASLGLTDVRLLIGLNPNKPLVSPSLFKGLQRLRTNEGVEVRCLHGLHAKMYVAPGKAVVVSSANFTRSGFEQLSEVAIETTDDSIVAAVEALFLSWWRAATPIDSVALQPSRGS